MDVGKLGMECTNRGDKSSEVMIKLADAPLVWTRNRAMAICLVYRPVSFLAAPALLIGLLASWSGIKEKN
jgi:hypothetical protein